MATQFIPRTNSNGMVGNPCWYSSNPYYLNGYGLPNCTCYAWGRWMEILGQAPTTLAPSNGNAETWWGNTTQLAKGSTPRLGAVICFADGPYSGLGHVAVVERIDSNGICHFSESNYGGAYFWYDVHKGNASNNYGFHYAYRFQGFIYLPTDYDPPGPGPDPDPPPYRPSQGNMFDSDFFLKYTKRRPF